MTAEFPLSRFTPKAIRVLRDRKLDTPESANERLRAIRRVFGWAIAEDHLSTNPSRDVPYFASNTQDPFTHGGFGNWFRRRCNEAGLSPLLSPWASEGWSHDRCGEWSEHQLMTIFGWLTPKQAALYTRAARQKKLAGDAMSLLLEGKEGT